ncbi:hypothetical protein ACFX2G_003381 [Malus domestica]
MDDLSFDPPSPTPPTLIVDDPSPPRDTIPDPLVPTPATIPPPPNPIPSPADIPPTLPPQLSQRSSSRITQPPSYLQQFHVGVPLPSRPHQSSASTVSSHTGSTSHPLSHSLTYARLSPTHCAFTASLSLVKEPHNYLQVIQDPKWCQAMRDEVTALEANHTWTFNLFLLGRNPSAANGSTKSNSIQMAQWNATKHAWSPKGIHKSKASITPRHFLLLLN